jgi:hypothetical protein
MVEIRAGEPVTIRQDRAYILFRSVRPEGAMRLEPVFLRIPRDEEMARYGEARRQAYARAEPGLIRRREAMLRTRANLEAQGRRSFSTIPPPPSIDSFEFIYEEIGNLQNIDDSRAFVRGAGEDVYLVEIVPGDYVLYGIAYAGGPAFLPTCLCLGTVGFSAPAGAVTDLGRFYADRVDREARQPELRAESGFGQTMSALTVLLGATVRPPLSGDLPPDALRGANVRAVQYRAVGKFFDPRAVMINRLVPVPGILAYEGGRVIDVRSGQAVPDIP